MHKKQQLFSFYQFLFIIVKLLLWLYSNSLYNGITLAICGLQRLYIHMAMAECGL